LLNFISGAYDPKPLDVWSAAIVMLCMCAGSYLWEEATPGKNSTYDALVKGWDKWYAKNGLDTVPDDSNYPYVNFFDAHINPPSLRKMLLRMLNPDPSKRLTIAEAVKKPWMKNTECCQVDSYDDPTVIIDATKRSCAKKTLKVVHHNHLPPSKHHGHNLVRLPGPTDM
jgi:protein-serine/threonine kinase